MADTSARRGRDTEVRKMGIIFFLTKAVLLTLGASLLIFGVTKGLQLFFDWVGLGRWE